MGTCLCLPFCDVKMPSVINHLFGMVEWISSSPPPINLFLFLENYLFSFVTYRVILSSLTRKGKEKKKLSLIVQLVCPNSKVWLVVYIIIEHVLVLWDPPQHLWILVKMLSTCLQNGSLYSSRFDRPLIKPIKCCPKKI